MRQDKTNKMSITNVSYAFLCISQFNNFLKSVSCFVLFFMSLIGYNTYTIRTKECKNIILRNIQKKYKIFCHKFDENNEPIGTCIHCASIPQFVISEDDLGRYYIFCSTTMFNEVSRYDYETKPIELDENFIPENSDKEIGENLDDSDSKGGDDAVATANDVKQTRMKYVMKAGEYGYFHYKTRKINLLQVQPTNEMSFFAYQERLFKNIMNFYKNTNYCKVFLNGDPGCGKTYFAYMMAQKLGCYLCDSFDPYEPSANFNELYTLMKLDACCPLIVLIDEVDILIEKIHNKPMEEHKKFRREIFDKNSWNGFMDKIEYGLYPNVILITNSNKPKSVIDKLDPSYLRNGRMNIVDTW
jgi:hypothetical protein